MGKDETFFKKTPTIKVKENTCPIYFHNCVCVCAHAYENKMRGSMNYKALDKYEGFLAEITTT